MQGPRSSAGWRSSLVAFAPPWNSEVLERRGAQQRQRPVLLGKLLVYQSGPPKGMRGHARQVFRHAHAGEDWQLFGYGGGAVLHRKTCSRAPWCRDIAQSRGGVVQTVKAGRNPKDGGWLSEPVWQGGVSGHVASADGVQAATKVGWDWCGTRAGA